MFKDLKSKLEDEAKRLQATVSQYSESIAQQVRSGMSDTGSDSGGHARRLFNSVTTRNAPSHSSNFFDNENRSDFSVEQMDGHNPNISAVMQEIPESDLFSESRERRNSNASVESNDSSFGNLFSAIPGLLSSGQRLTAIPSDVESESVTTSSQFQSASKEQISTVLHKLQGRAANYRDKYQRLVQLYNESTRENEKFRSVLASTQDKSLNTIYKLRQKNRQLIEKIKELEYDKQAQDTKETETKVENELKELQSLLEECNSNLQESKEKIRQLTEENQTLKNNAEASTDEQKNIDLAIQRTITEWKGRVDCIEEEWSKRLLESQEAGTLAIAKVKAEMHGALEEKEIELQTIRARCKLLEINGSDALRQIDELKATVDALENEKADMIEKLSEAKQQGVKAVRYEEEEKRQELMKEMDRKRMQERQEDERHFQEMIKKNDEQWTVKFKELEEQMQLAIEEREMQKVAAVIEHDRKNDNLGVQVEELTAEKLHLKSVMDDMTERHRRQMDELSNSIENDKQRHQQEIAAISRKQEEAMAELRKKLEEATEINKRLSEELKVSKNNGQKAVEGVENRNGQLINELAKERQKVDDLKNEHENVLVAIRAKMSSLEDSLQKTTKEKDIIVGELMNRNTELGNLKQQLSELRKSESKEKKAMDDLHRTLERKAAKIMSLESEKEILSSELTSTRELAKTHQHLQEQLRRVQLERDEVEKKYSEMEQRVQQAVQELEEDRQILRQAKEELEKRLGAQYESESKEIETSEGGLEETSVKVQKKKDDLKEKVRSLIFEYGQLENCLKSQQAQTQKLRLENQALIEELENVKNELSGEREEMKQIIANHNDVNNELSKAREELNLIRCSKEDLENKLQSIREDLEKELNEKLEHNENLRSQNEFLKAELETKQKQLEMLLTDNMTSYDAMLGEAANVDSQMSTYEQELMLNDSRQSAVEDLVSLEDVQHGEKGKSAAENKMLLFGNENSGLLNKIEIPENSVQKEKKEENMTIGLGEICESRNNLRTRMEELKETVWEAFTRKGHKIGKNKNELDKIDKTPNWRNTFNSTAITNNEKFSNMDALLMKMEELEAVSEKLGNELLRKENIINELYKRMAKQGLEDFDMDLPKEDLEQERKQEVDFKKELNVIKEILDTVKNELEERKTKEECLEKVFVKRRRKAEGNENMKNQSALVMENAHNSVETQKQLDVLNLVKIEKDRIVSELSLAKKDFQKAVQQMKEENEQRIEEIRKIAEQKVLKLKKQCEMDEQATKAELLLQVDEMRSEIVQKELLIKEQKLNISSLEKKLFGKGASEEILEGLQDSVELLTDEMNSKSNKLIEVELRLEAVQLTAEEAKQQLEFQIRQNASLKNELEQSEAQKAHLLEKSVNFEKEIEKLQSEIVVLRETANEESAKAFAKAESERQRLLRDLQKEIKQLYRDLNERTQQLDEAQSRLQELSNWKLENQEVNGATHSEAADKTVDPGERLRSDSDRVEQTDYEELCTLRERVSEYQRQLEDLKEAHSKEVALLCKKASSTSDSNIIGFESLTNGILKTNKEDLDESSLAFVEPTEAEYLRNVLYRYMNERETLGRESVTLARVIATVARFTHEQVNTVVAKEEQRNYGWIGGTMHGLITSATHLSSH